MEPLLEPLFRLGEVRKDVAQGKWQAVAGLELQLVIV